MKITSDLIRLVLALARLDVEAEENRREHGYLRDLDDRTIACLKVYPNPSLAIEPSPIEDIWFDPYPN